MEEGSLLIALTADKIKYIKAQLVELLARQVWLSLNRHPSTVGSRITGQVRQMRIPEPKVQ